MIVRSCVAHAYKTLGKITGHFPFSDRNVKGVELNADSIP